MCLCSLQDDSTASIWGQYTVGLQRHWTCGVCGVSMVVTVAERLTHEHSCGTPTVSTASISTSMCITMFPHVFTVGGLAVILVDRIMC